MLRLKYWQILALCKAHFVKTDRLFAGFCAVDLPEKVLESVRAGETYIFWRGGLQPANVRRLTVFLSDFYPLIHLRFDQFTMLKARRMRYFLYY